MCDQTEVIYSPGDVVWVKLGPIWWPGQVYDYEKLPEEITANLRKTPIAVVKFFQEDSYEYVKNLNAIYHYNCRRKHEFIKKGLDVIRSNNRDVPSNMKMFPNDVVTAERLTDGNLRILEEEEFAPKEKEDYSELFGKKTPKKGKTDSSKKDSLSWRLKPFSESATKANRHSLATSTVLRPITHHRFITKALEGRSDHEVRIRQQVSEKDPDCPAKLYNCHLCGFSSSRINVIILHNKSHSAGYAEAYLHPESLPAKARKKSKGDRKIAFSVEKRQRVNDTTKSDEPLAKKKKGIKSPKEVSEVTVDDSFNESPVKSTSPVKKPIFGKKKSAKDKADKIAREKQQNDAFRENLLKDWDDEDFGDDDADERTGNDSSSEKDCSKEESVGNSSGQKSDSFTKPKETSCFDFDDTEDGLDIRETITKFGQKIPRILGDKSRKQINKISEQSPVKVRKHELEESCLSGEVGEKDKTMRIASDESLIKTDKKDHEKSSEKCNEDLDTVFKSLLDETVVPDIPEAPAHLEIIKRTTNLDQTTLHDEKDGDSGGGQIGDGGGGINTVVEENELNDFITSDKIPNDKVITSDSQSKTETIHSKDESNSNADHFLVKTSEEVATFSSDDAHLEDVSSPNENNVASSSTESADVSDLKNKEESETISKEETVVNTSVSIVEDTVVNTSVSILAENSCFTDVHKETKIIDTPSNGFEKNEQSEIYDKKSDELVSAVSIVNAPSIDAAVPDLQPLLPSSALKQESNNFREMDFDINSMPVIIGDDMIEQEEALSVNDSKPLMTTHLSSVKSQVSNLMENKFLSVKTSPKQVMVDSMISSSSLPIVVKEEIGCSQSAVVTKEGRLPAKKLILSPTSTVAVTRPTQVATIKVQPSTATAINKLTVPGSMIAQKGLGTTSQVLILKSTAPSGKSTLQKISNTSQVIQQGGKVLILTNPQGVPTQSKIITQKNLSPNKLTGTRILTTKGTVLTTGSPSVVTKANILASSSKTVTTKSGQKILINKGGIISQSPKSVIINKSGLLTTVNSPSVISSKPSLIAQNILTSKCETIATTQVNLSQIAPAPVGSSKIVSGAGVITASGMNTNSSMVLTPLNMGKNTTLTNSQKLKLITSKASPVATSAGGTKLLVQGTQSRVILPSSLQKNQQLKFVGNLKGQSNTGTILIQTSQGVIATTPLSSSQVINKTKQSLKSPIPTILSAKSNSLQATQTTLQPQNKFLVQKVKAGPNILQKTQKKPIQRNAKKSIPTSHLLTSIASQQTVQASVTLSQSTISPSQDTLIIPSASGLPVIGQSAVVSGTQLDSSNQTALVYLTVDESGNYRQLETTPVVNYEGAATDSQTLYIDPGTADLDNIFLAIDDAGNVVNIARPVQNTFTTENSVAPPSQDILAKALADTQVLQQETIVADNSTLGSAVSSSVLRGCMFVEQPAQYPQPSLSHGVLETSLTLNQPPIMTPLEVPSTVSPRSLDQISSLQSGFLNDSGLLTTDKDKKNDLHPSMPLLTEDTDCVSSSKSETVFFTQVDGSHAVLTPVSSGSQLAFQLALDGNNVIVSSTSGLPSLGVTSDSNTPQNTTAPLIQSEIQTMTSTDNIKTFMNVNDAEITPVTFSDEKEEIVEDIKSSLKDHSPSVTENPCKSITDQSVVYETAVPVSSDENSTKGLAVNNIVGNSDIQDIAVVSTDTDISLCSAPDDDRNKLLQTELIRSKVTHPYSDTGIEHIQNQQTVSVINTAAFENPSDETVNVSEGEHYSTMIDVTFSNGEVSQRNPIKRRLPSESNDSSTQDSIPLDDGSECKRIKLEER